MRAGRMILYLGKKILFFFLSVLFLSAAVFLVSRLAPGDPLRSYYGDRVEKMTPAERERAEDRLGLNEPLLAQYARWLGNALQGDLGISYQYKQDVGEVIASRAENTLILGGIGFSLVFALSLLLGILCAWQEGGLLDRVACKIGAAVSCIPDFWLSLLLLTVFSAGLGWLPSSGAYSIGKEGGWEDRILHLILPLSVVVLGHVWYYAFLVRSRILEEAGTDYALLARAKGMSKRKVLSRHCLRGAMPAYLSIMAVSVPHILGGTYIVETVFSYPGIGALAYESARYKDYNLLMALCVLSGALVILCGMAAQAINEWIDPRMRGEEKEKMELAEREP